MIQPGKYSNCSKASNKSLASSKRS
jgi:hypothetical protein